MKLLWNPIVYIVCPGLETYFCSKSRTFASGFNLNSQIPVSNSQLVFPTSEVFNIAALYGYSFLGWELGSSFSPPLAENDAFFLLLFKEMCYFFRHRCHMARQQVCVMRRFDFSTAFTVDSLKHLWDQDRDLVLYEISNSQLFSSAYILNSQNWISTRILRVCKREFRALNLSFTRTHQHSIEKLKSNQKNSQMLPKWIKSFTWTDRMHNINKEIVYKVINREKNPNTINLPLCSCVQASAAAPTRCCAEETRADPVYSS